MIRPPMLFAFALSSLASSAAMAQGASPAEREMEHLRGTFSMVSGRIDGQDMPSAMTATMKRVSEGDQTTVTMAGQLYMKANYTVNATATPKTIDYAMTGGFSAGKKQLGIYRVSGDTVTFCFGSPDKPRPTEFTSGTGSGVTCSVWKRER